MKRINLITLYFALLVLSSGCFQSADRDKATISSSPSMATISRKALASSSFEEGTLDKQWWKIFESSELDGLMLEAIENSPTLKVAEAKIVAAQAAAKSIRSKLFPQLTADAANNWSYLSKYGFFRDFFPLPPAYVIPFKFNETDLSLNFSYEIDFWGKNRKKLESALGLAISQQMEKEQTELVLCEAVAFAYFEWQAHTAEKLLYEKWLVTENNLSYFFASRYEIGIDNVIPPLMQDQSLGELKQKIVDIEKTIEIDLFFLNNLLGKGPDNKISLTFAPERFLKKIHLPEHLGLDLLSQRPDLMAQIWKVSSAADSIQVAKTEFYPNVNLKALTGLSSLIPHHLFEWAGRTGSLTPAIHLPLFTGGQLTANLNKQVALFNEEVHTYNQMLLQATENVAKEISTFLAIEQQLLIQESIVEVQRKAGSLARLRFEQGLDDYKPSLTALEKLFTEELNAIYLNHSQVLSTLRLIQSLGGGFKAEKLPFLKELHGN